MLEDFTLVAKQSVVAAQESARMLGHESIGTEHLLIGVLREGGDPGATALTQMGITDPDLALALEKTLGVKDPQELTPPFDMEARTSLEVAVRESRALGDPEVGAEHVLLAIISASGSGACGLLRKVGVEPDAVRSKVIGLVNESRVGSAASFDASAPFAFSADAATTSKNGPSTAGVTTPPQAPTPAPMTSPARPGPSPTRPPAPPALKFEAPAASAERPAEPPAQAEPEEAPEEEVQHVRTAAGAALGQILVEQGAVTQSQLEEVLDGAKDKLLGRALVDLGLINDSDLVGALSVQIGLEFVNLATYPIEDWAVKLIPADAAWRHHVVPIGERDGKLLVAMSNPRDERALADVRTLTNREVQPVVAMSSSIERALRQYMGPQTDGTEVTARQAPGRSAAAVPATNEDWQGPPDRTIGTSIDFTPVLAVTRAGVFVAITDVIVYPTGMRVVVTLRRPAAPKSEKWFEARGWQDRWHGESVRELLPGSFMVGVEFPDGSRADSRAPFVPGKPKPPAFVPLGADGSSGRVDVHYWVWPLPREGEGVFFCEWTSEGVELVGTPFDCATLAEAADRAHILWGTE